ncbi:MAG: phospho-sugar mutase [Verrucomicrobia bacterium]|jgi:phosphoglucomutase|nr:phospho-sugar mutase [Verrucomicrobiota bacterium]
MENLPALLQEGLRHGLLGSSLENIESLLAAHPESYERSSIAELASSGNWEELNNRFFRTLAFGTGGLRGKTIGTVVTTAERGIPQAMERPQFPCTGTNAMNDRNVSRATQGLVAYVKDWARREKLPHRPRICISYDTRYFSREFADLAAKVITELGCDALVFAEPRPTPELSFAVRQTDATAGINLTASHNPSAYNGYKVYFNDGGQVIEPHASGIIARVNAVPSPHYEPVPRGEQGRRVTLGTEMDESYLDRLERVVLDPALVAREKGLKIVYSPLHGVGASIIMPLLRRLGFDATAVPEQVVPDSRFPTVKSPNPEYAEALTMALELADEIGADVVMATDPDDDRMGVAVRNRAGRMELLTGNQIGSMLAYYRASRMFELGILDETNKSRGVIIKTFVTTDLQKAVAEHFGLRCVETLTGFKYNAAKLRQYEEAIPEALRADYRRLPEEETRRLRLAHSMLLVMGGEESYGYTLSDFARDKDANAAVAAFAEVVAYARSRGMTAMEYLDEIFATLGVYLERGESLVFEGAEGAGQIAKLAASYVGKPPDEMDGAAVVKMENFAVDTIHDTEGERIPAEGMIIFTLADGRRCAVRPSGTEPKIKYYIFGLEKPPGRKMTAEEVAAARGRVQASVDRLWDWLHADALRRGAA